MKNVARYWPALLVAAPVAFGGHWLAYTLATALQHAGQLQPEGTHRYLPGAEVVSAAFLMLAVSAALALLTLLHARLLDSLPRWQRVQAEADSGDHARSWILVMFLCQSLVFLVQECLEAHAVGHSVDPVGLVTLAIIGQAPLAAIAGMVLGWFAIRLVRAVRLARLLRDPSPPAVRPRRRALLPDPPLHALIRAGTLTGRAPPLLSAGNS
ncbi:MAG: hypothetical protein ACYDAY_08570 [Candidatus Dormibacteria bacterium]